MRKLRFKTLKEAVKELKALDKKKDLKTTGKWSYYQIMEHCSVSLEGCVSGYGRKAPWLIRKLFGASTMNKVLKNGFVGPDMMNPSAPKKREEGNEKAALKRLLKSIETFEKHKGPMEDHPFFGPMTKEQYTKWQAHHLAHHLGFVELGK